MAILDKSKLRPDIVKLMESRAKVQLQGIGEFLMKEENQGINFSALWQKVMIGNARFFEQKGIDKDLSTWITFDEMFFLARLLRFVSDYAADANQKNNPILNDVTIEPVSIEGVTAEWQDTKGVEKDKVVLYFHGGGWILGSPNDHRLLTTSLSRSTRMRVLSVAYRLAPEHPFPAHLDDCIIVYKWLLKTGVRPENIIIAGDSAGGNLALTTLIKLRDDKIPLPAGAVLLSPSTDFTFSDDSFFKNGETDPILAEMGIFWWFQAYLADENTINPLISPLFADLTDLPPLFFQVSPCEMLYSDSTRFVDKALNAGVDAEIETWNDMVHVFQVGQDELPEAGEAIQSIGKFIEKHIKKN